MEPTFLKERLARFLKIIPAEYKVADPMKKSPKGWTTTIERIPGAKKQKAVVNLDEEKAPAKSTEKQSDEPEKSKSKKRSLDDLLDIEGGLI
jgi:hypothetical protein